jgi:hypothetical protein
MQLALNKKAERAEKEKLKQLTLNINDRMEQEELHQGSLIKVILRFNYC